MNQSLPNASNNGPEASSEDARPTPAFPSSICGSDVISEGISRSSRESPASASDNSKISHVPNLAAVEASIAQADPRNKTSTHPAAESSLAYSPQQEPATSDSEVLPEELSDGLHESHPSKNGQWCPSVPESPASPHSRSEMKSDGAMDTSVSRQHHNPPESDSPRSDSSIPQEELSPKAGKSLKRSLDKDSVIAPASKQPRIESLDESSGIVPREQKQVPPTPPRTGAETPPTLELEKTDAKHSMEIFPGGRGVPSPTYGFKERSIPSPLVEMSFSSKLAPNRNPFMSRSHRPSATTDWRRGLPLISSSDEFPSLDVSETSARDVVKSAKGGLFDNPEAEEVCTLPRSRQKSKKKKGSPPRERLSLDKANFTSPKDCATATRLLARINSISGIVPRNEAMWLGTNMWIFTVEQLEYSLSALSKSPNKEPGHDLLQCLACSALCGFKDAGVVEAETRPFKVPGNCSAKSSAVSRVAESENTTVSSADPAFASTAGATLRATPPTSKSQIPQDKSGNSSDDEFAISVKCLPCDINSNEEANQKPRFKDNSAQGPVAGERTPIDVGFETPQTPHVNDDNVASRKGDAPVEAKYVNSIPSGDNTPSPKHLERAAAILERWRACVAKFRAGTDQKGTDTFLLSGPIGQLLPKLVRQFLESVRVYTLLDFFSLKKTEASPLIAYYKDWRKHCLLPPLKGYCLARHLIGMSIRLEKAVRSLPPADAETRKWMSTVLVILTGSSKEFIIDECRVFDVEYFLNERTKEWSDRLVQWRIEQKQPPLKGSGKVAMVSGWKTSLKDSLDVEKGHGRVLTEAELLKAPPRGADEEEPESEVEESEQKLEIAMTPVKKPEKVSPEQVVYNSGKAALRSEDFLLSVLRAENVRFLNSIGIRNAEQLIECDKQPKSLAIAALVKYRTDATAIQAQPATCVRLMYDWTQRVKTKLKEIKCHAVGSLAKKRGPKSKEDGEPLGPVVVAQPKKPSPKPVRPKNSCKVFGDPMDALSAGSRSFLESLGISDANTFLATKTSTMSMAYVTWREKENMPPLKGYGAIATVSGWKAQVRKAALDAGEHSLAATEPADRYGKLTNTVAKVAHEAVPSFFDSVLVVPKRSSSLLCGMSEKRFLVQGPTGTCQFSIVAPRIRIPHRFRPTGLAFAFALSVRDSTLEKGEMSTFLTYLGHRNVRTIQASASDLEDRDRLPLLIDVTDTWNELDAVERSSFSSLSEGCGVIDMGEYGVLQPPEGHLATLKKDIMSLLERKDVIVDTPNVDSRHATDMSGATTVANIFHVDAPLRRTCQLFFQSTPLQPGQVVELLFAPRRLSYEKMYHHESPTVLLRSMIINQVSKLTTYEIEEILLWTLEQSKQPLCTTEQNQMELTVLRRRFHWVASSLLYQFDILEKNSELQHKHPGRMNRGVIQKTTDSLLMKGLHFQGIRSAIEPSKHRSYASLFGEISDEIEASLIAKGGGTSPSDPSVHCQLAVTLRRECQRAVSIFILLKAHDSLNCQQALLNEFCELARNATSNVLSNEMQLELLVLTRQDESGENDAAIATGSNWRMPVFRSLDDVRNGDAEVNRYWYVHHQIFSTVHSVASCTQIPWSHTPDPLYTYATLVSEVCGFLPSKHLDDIPKSTAPDWSHNSRYLDRSMFRGFATVSPIPNSMPLFLGLVWPKLRSCFGWRIDAGESRNDVVFLPPGQKNRAKRRNDVTAKLKQERRKKRAKLDSKLKEVGFGYVPKLTKRLVVQAHTSESENTQAEISVRRACEMFGEFMLSQTSQPKSEAHRHRIDAIVNGICKCFEELLPVFEPSWAVQDTGDPLSRKYGCEQLITMLIVMPSVLQQLDVPIRQIEDSTHLIKDLVKFLSGHYDTCFDKEFRPFFEAYGGEPEFVDDFLPPKLNTLATCDGDGLSANDIIKKEESALVRDLLLPDDVHDLTDFTAMAMRQMAPCRAGLADSSKKGRKHVPIGYPGLVCAHCWGVTEGKYFFTSPDSLGTAGGVIYTHLTRCPKFPPSELKRLTSFKGQQAEARKHLKYGAQASYFNRLWKRLHNANSIGGTPGVFLRQQSSVVDDLVVDEDTDDEKAPTDNSTLEFKSHLDLLEYIERTAPWSKECELVAAVNLYHSALHHGGRIYNTNSTPSHFSSEWLLAKISPVSLHKHCSGAGVHG